METPQPVNLSKLKDILGNAKKLMNVVESNNYERGNIDARALSEDTFNEIPEDEVKKKIQTNNVDYTEEMVRNSNLPSSIKEAMIRNPIPKVSMANTTFSLEDVQDEKPMKHKQPQPQKRYEETLNKNIGINREELKEIIDDLVNEKLLEFFIKNHNKSITELAVKRTISTLINEGKLAGKRKTI